MAQVLTLVEAARWLRVPVRTLQRSLDAGGVPTTTSDGAPAIATDDLEAWLAARRVQPGDLAWAHQVRDPETGRWSWLGAVRRRANGDEGTRAHDPNSSTAPDESCTTSKASDASGPTGPAGQQTGSGAKAPRS